MSGLWSPAGEQLPDLGLSPDLGPDPDLGPVQQPDRFISPDQGGSSPLDPDQSLPGFAPAPDAVVEEELEEELTGTAKGCNFAPQPGVGALLLCFLPLLSFRVRRGG